CHFIVISDAGSDPGCSFADLGESVRKIRVDFGIPIDFDQMNIYPRSQTDAAKQQGHNCAIGRIRYSAVDGSTAPDASAFTSSRCVTVMSRATSTNTLRGAKHSRTRVPVISFSRSHSLRATECSAHTRWRSSARMVAEIFDVSPQRS